MDAVDPHGFDSLVPRGKDPCSGCRGRAMRVKYARSCYTNSLLVELQLDARESGKHPERKSKMEVLPQSSIASEVGRLIDDVPTANGVRSGIKTTNDSELSAAPSQTFAEVAVEFES